MKRLTTYYFLLLAGSNLLLAQYLPSAITLFEDVISKGPLGGMQLPFVTERVFGCPWWPWVGVAICVFGAMLSLLGIPKDNVLKNLLVIFLIIEFWALFTTMAAFHMPFIILNPT